MKTMTPSGMNQKLCWSCDYTETSQSWFCFPNHAYTFIDISQRQWKSHSTVTISAYILWLTSTALKITWKHQQDNMASKIHIPPRCHICYKWLTFINPSNVRFKIVAAYRPYIFRAKCIPKGREAYYLADGRPNPAASLPKPRGQRETKNNNPGRQNFTHHWTHGLHC